MYFMITSQLTYYRDTSTPNYFPTSLSGLREPESQFYLASHHDMMLDDDLTKI